MPPNTPNSVENSGIKKHVCASVFRPVVEEKHKLGAHVVTITLATQVTRKAEKVAG